MIRSGKLSGFIKKNKKKYWEISGFLIITEKLHDLKEQKKSRTMSSLV